MCRYNAFCPGVTVPLKLTFSLPTIQSDLFSQRFPGIFGNFQVHLLGWLPYCLTSLHSTQYSIDALSVLTNNDFLGNYVICMFDILFSTLSFSSSFFCSVTRSYKNTVYLSFFYQWNIFKIALAILAILYTTVL